ncbi:MAG TPA: hypothetical protein PLG34_08090 [Spirochaetota bacterium]|nr:MAG: hypothetical protein BWX91_01728 [Spirochaetes bacterium ADurb.Bin133]HNZ26875.1 hypothetical protein [Spirochaetota bacterium]HPY87927.1 hypothetical protein [Spirochaetota bacterium]
MKFISIILLIIITFSSCLLEKEIKMDKNIAPEESRLDTSFLMKESLDDLFIIESSNEIDSKVAIDTATAKGRYRMSEYVKKNMERILADFLISADADPSSDLFAFVVRGASDNLAEVALHSSTVDRVFQDKETEPHTFFTVIKFALKDFAKDIDVMMNKYIESYVKMNSTRPFGDFKKQILNLKSSDFKDN